MKIANFNFGKLTLTVGNPDGVYFMSNATKEKIAAMSLPDLQEANKAAWKQRKQYERIMNRYNNVTLYPGVYDSVAGPHGITEAVCKETYKRICAAKQ